MSDYFKDQAKILKRYLKKDKEEIAFMEWLISIHPNYKEDPLGFAYVFDGVLDSKRKSIEKYNEELKELNTYIKERV